MTIWTCNSTAMIFWCVAQHKDWKIGRGIQWTFSGKEESVTHFLKRRISLDEFGWHVELDQRYVKTLLDAMAMNRCKSMATPGSKGTGGRNWTQRNIESSDLVLESVST